MQSENKNIFTMKNDKGETVECEVLMTIDSEEFGKNYLVYTDHKIDENGSIQTYAGIYDPTGKNLNIDPVTTEEEWDMIESVLASAQKQVLKEQMEENQEAA